MGRIISAIENCMSGKMFLPNQYDYGGSFFIIPSVSRNGIRGGETFNGTIDRMKGERKKS